MHRGFLPTTSLDALNFFHNFSPRFSPARSFDVRCGVVPSSIEPEQLVSARAFSRRENYTGRANAGVVVSESNYVFKKRESASVAVFAGIIHAG